MERQVEVEWSVKWRLSGASSCIWHGRTPSDQARVCFRECASLGRMCPFLWPHVGHLGLDTNKQNKSLEHCRSMVLSVHVLSDAPASAWNRSPGTLKATEGRGLERDTGRNTNA